MKNKIKTIILLACLLSAGIATAQMPGTPYLPTGCKPPSTPKSISGPSCVTNLTYSGSMVYSITTVTGATAYIWTLPDGWTQVSGGNTESITVQPSGPAINGTISAAASNGCATSAQLTIAVSYQNGIPMPEFAPTNLGADPTYDDPKKQMQYTYGVDFPNTDGHIIGGMYQWGRKNLPYAISTDGNYTNYVGTTTNAAFLQNPVYDADGQIVKNAGGDANSLFIMTQTTGTTWRQGEATAAYPIGQLFSLWGNGRNIEDPTNGLGLSDPGILRSDGNYYQSTSWVMPQNNPCPSGYRVPTEDEWARYLNYDCDGQNARNSAVSIPATVLWANTNTGFTWVRVLGAIPSLTWSITTQNRNCGYAVYRTDDWNTAINTGGYFATLLQNGSNITAALGSKTLSDAGAPMPVLFLSISGARTANPPNGSSQYGANDTRYTAGFYHCSTIFSRTYTMNLYFTATSVQTYFMSGGSGIAIRCVKDPTMP